MTVSYFYIDIFSTTKFSIKTQKNINKKSTFMIQCNSDT